MANTNYSFKQILLEKNWMQYILNNNINITLAQIFIQPYTKQYLLYMRTINIFYKKNKLIIDQRLKS